jgi:flagellar hook-basal body complex protein FliE
MSILPVGSGGVVPVGVEGAQARPADRSFAQVVQNLLVDANGQQLQADQAVQQLALGQTDNIHQVMIAISQADLSLRTVLEIRNRLTEAYQDIMRMQV